MFFFTSLPAGTLARARADQVATLYARSHMTTLSMAFGALLLCGVMWGQVSPLAMISWIGLIFVNQAWRALLARAWRRARPGVAAASRWGRYWALGSTIAGALWGVAGVVMFPEAPAHQALIIVCLFGVVMGGLNLTAVYKPSFYGFVLPALVPLIVRVAFDGAPVHLFTAAVMTVVLGFVLGFGHRLNDVLTHSLAIRYQNVDLIGELRDRSCVALDARQSAEAANRAKSQLLAAASHDLRQPLHALGLYVAALDAQVRGAQQRRLVTNVQTAVSALEMQFDQLIDLSRLETGTLAPERSGFALEPLFERLRREFGPNASARGLRLAIVPTRLLVNSDEALLERILRNLIANAVRYTVAGGVLVGARRRGAQVVIEVADTGLGIAAEHRDRIFEEFYRVRDASTSDRARRGLGLGLALVRRFADLLGHRVALASVPGRGSTFSVTLPRVYVQPRVPAPMRAEVRSAPSRSRPLQGNLVAIVDDDEAALDAMRVLFVMWGAQTVCADTLDRLLANCMKLPGPPDLLVADLRLADGACGVDAVTALRNYLDAPVPGMIVSGDTGADAQRRATDAGLTLLPKPVDARALRDMACDLVGFRVGDGVNAALTGAHPMQGVAIAGSSAMRASIRRPT